MDGVSSHARTIRPLFRWSLVPSTIVAAIRLYADEQDVTLEQAVTRLLATGLNVDCGDVAEASEFTRGDRVIYHWGRDIGRRGTVVNVTKTRVVVRFDDFDDSGNVLIAHGSPRGVSPRKLRRPF